MEKWVIENKLKIKTMHCIVMLELIVGCFESRAYFVIFHCTYIIQARLKQIDDTALADMLLKHIGSPQIDPKGRPQKIIWEFFPNDKGVLWDPPYSQPGRY